MVVAINLYLTVHRNYSLPKLNIVLAIKRAWGYLSQTSIYLEIHKLALVLLKVLF